MIFLRETECRFCVGLLNSRLSRGMRGNKDIIMRAGNNHYILKARLFCKAVRKKGHYPNRRKKCRKSFSEKIGNNFE